MGRDYFHRISKFNSSYDYKECDAQYNNCLKAKGTGVTMATIYYLAQQNNIKILTEKPIVNNNVTEVYVIVELKTEELKVIDIGPYFEEKGLLSKEFPQFEYRHEQYEMAKFIEKGINDSKKVIIEAGTGTGKTLAYLIPAIEWAKINEKKVIISTNTINLQEQLLSKDIPLVKKVLEHDFTYALLKGRGNYACLKKNDQLNHGELVDLSDLSEGQKGQMNSVIKWLDLTEVGDKAELPFDVENAVWEYFASEADLCTPAKCPHREACFFLKAREEKLKADVLISNHHLYFADLAIRKEAGFENLKGHRTVGGMRASIYNAMPYEGVVALVDFMKKFEEENL